MRLATRPICQLNDHLVAGYPNCLHVRERISYSYHSWQRRILRLLTGRLTSQLKHDALLSADPKTQYARNCSIVLPLQGRNCCMHDSLRLHSAQPSLFRSGRALLSMGICTLERSPRHLAGVPCVFVPPHILNRKTEYPPNHPCGDTSASSFAIIPYGVQRFPNGCGVLQRLRCHLIIDLLQAVTSIYISGRPFEKAFVFARLFFWIRQSWDSSRSWGGLITQHIRTCSCLRGESIL